MFPKTEESLKEMDRLNFDYAELRQRLLEEDSFVLNLIDTIPPKMYFDQEVQERLTAEKHAIMDKRAEGLKRKGNGQQELTSRNKHKRARLDPHQHKSVSQIQQELANEKSFKNKKSKGVIFSSATLTRAANIEELQKRLEERIKASQEKRRGCTESEFLAKKRLKRKISRMKKNQKGNMKKGQEDKTPVPTPQKKPRANHVVKPIYNKDGRIIYSKFDFTETGETGENRKKKTGKNYKKLIQHAASEKEKIENLKLEDSDKANKLIAKHAWQRALQKAEGVKLKDDPAILKKSLKKREKKKNKSSKEWDARIKQTEKIKEKRQEKRKKNIQAKKKEKLDQKIKRAKKKGRIIPGF